MFFLVALCLTFDMQMVQNGISLVAKTQKELNTIYLWTQLNVSLFNFSSSPYFLQFSQSICPQCITAKFDYILNNQIQALIQKPISGGVNFHVLKSYVNFRMKTQNPPLSGKLKFQHISQLALISCFCFLYPSYLLACSRNMVNQLHLAEAHQ